MADKKEETKTTQKTKDDTHVRELEKKTEKRPDPVPDPAKLTKSIGDAQKKKKDN